MVRDGINPENIVVVLPDDSLLENYGNRWNQGQLITLQWVQIWTHHQLPY